MNRSVKISFVIPIVTDARHVVSGICWLTRSVVTHHAGKATTRSIGMPEDGWWAQQQRERAKYPELEPYYVGDASAQKQAERLDAAYRSFGT